MFFLCHIYLSLSWWSLYFCDQNRLCVNVLLYNAYFWKLSSFSFLSILKYLSYTLILRNSNKYFYNQTDGAAFHSPIFLPWCLISYTSLVIAWSLFYTWFFRCLYFTDFIIFHVTYISFAILLVEIICSINIVYVINKNLALIFSSLN